MTEAMETMLNREAKIMELRPETGPVVEYHGSGESRTVRALEALGLVRSFSLCPYDTWFFRVTDADERAQHDNEMIYLDSVQHRSNDND